MKQIIKIIALVLALGIVFAGCGKKEEKELVKIGEYKGFKMTAFDVTVTEEEINTAISQFLSDNKYKVDITDRGAAMGDTVNIDFEGIVDGVAFEGGKAEGYEISVLCSGGFIDGFEKAIVGKKPGECFSADLKFPDVYPNNPDLAGKPVTFNYTLNSIKQTIVPEYNDETVEKYAGYPTTADYEEHLRSYFKTQKQTAGEENQNNELWTQLFDVCEVIEYPKDRVEKEIEGMKEYFEMFAQMYQVTYEELLTMYAGFESVEKADEYMFEEAQIIVKTSLIVEAMVKEHNITYTDAEYNAFVNTFADENGFTPQEVIAKFGEEAVEEVVYQGKIIDLLREYAVEVPATEENK